MDIAVFQPAERPTVLRVLRSVLAPDEPLQPVHRRFLAAWARIVGDAAPALDPAPVEPGAVHLEGEHARKRLLQLAIMAALLNRPVAPASASYLTTLARSLGVADVGTEVVAALAEGRVSRARRIAVRRGMRGLIGDAWRAEGLAGVLRYFAALLLKVPVHRDRLARYKRLGLLPEGTLGRTYWAHMTEVGFNFPGEPGGIPDTLAYHDVTHVLAGHPATGAGEIQQGCFQAGSRRQDGFFFVLFVLLQFHHGIMLTPNSPPETGLFDPDRVLWALHRGASCPVDVTRSWDFWPLMRLPLAEARRACGIIPAPAASAG